MSEATAQEKLELAVLEATFPRGGIFPLFLPQAIYDLAKDDPRFTNVWIAPTPMLPTAP